ncbi:MAG: M48 family metallopeptidase [Pleomorphochaeta sp.]
MFDKNEIEYKLIKSKKYKRLRISIKASHKIVVSSPQNVSNKKIEEFIFKNKEWIYKNLEKLDSEYNIKKHSYTDGDKFLFLGELYKLSIVENLEKSIVLDKENKIILVNIANSSKDQIISSINFLYKNETIKMINQIYNDNNELLKNYPKINKISVHKANTRWGSCSSKNNINFSYRLCMLPFCCMEYVFFHEIAHLREKNHSKNYYYELKNLLPSYKELETKIRYYERNYNLSLE